MSSLSVSGCHTRGRVFDRIVSLPLLTIFVWPFCPLFWEGSVQLIFKYFSEGVVPYVCPWKAVSSVFSCAAILNPSLSSRVLKMCLVIALCVCLCVCVYLCNCQYVLRTLEENC